MATVTAEPPLVRRFNWWKSGFFAALLAFEVTRELLVMAEGTPAMPMVSASVFHSGSWTAAEGRWRRIDNKGDLVPALIRIECDQDKGECTEISVLIHDNAVWSPNMDTFKAQFAPDAITYENVSPVCTHYAIRIDLRLQKVIGVRERTADKSELCRNMEGRIEMQLGDGWDLNRDATKGHFVPLLSLIKGTLQVLDGS